MRIKKYSNKTPKIKVPKYKPYRAPRSTVYRARSYSYRPRSYGRRSRSYSYGSRSVYIPMTDDKTANFLIILFFVIIPSLIPLYIAHPLIGAIGVVCAIWFSLSYFHEDDKPKAVDQTGALSSAPADLTGTIVQSTGPDKYGLKRDNSSGLTIAAPLNALQIMQGPGATMDNPVSLVPSSEDSADRVVHKILGGLGFCEEELLKLSPSSSAWGAKNTQGHTPLHALAMNKKIAQKTEKKWILEKVWRSLPEVDLASDTPAHMAIKNENEAFFRFLGQAIDECKTSELPRWFLRSLTIMDEQKKSWPECLQTPWANEFLEKHKTDIFEYLISVEENTKVLKAITDKLELKKEDILFMVIASIHHKDRISTLRWLLAEERLLEATDIITDHGTGSKASLLDIAIACENFEATRYLVDEFNLSPLGQTIPGTSSLDLSKNCKDTRITDYLKQIVNGENGIKLQVRTSLNRLVNVNWFTKSFSFDLALFLKEGRSRIKIFHGSSCTGKTEVVQRLSGLRKGIPGLKEIGLNVFYMTGLEAPLEVRKIEESCPDYSIVFIDEAEKFLNPKSTLYNAEVALRFTNMLVTLFEKKPIYWVLIGTFDYLYESGNIDEKLTSLYGTEFGTRVDYDWRFPDWTLENLMKAIIETVPNRKIQYDDPALAMMVQYSLKNKGGVRSFCSLEQRLMRMFRLENPHSEIMINGEFVKTYFQRNA